MFCRQWLTSLRLGTTEAECNGPLLDNPLFNSCLLNDLANIWTCCISMAASSNTYQFSTNATGCGDGLSALRRSKSKACQSVASAKEHTVLAMQRMGVIQATHDSTACTDDYDCDPRWEQDESLVTSVLQACLLVSATQIVLP